MPRIPQQNFSAQPNLTGAVARDSALASQGRDAVQQGQATEAQGQAITQAAGVMFKLASAKKQADDKAYVTEAFNKISRTESELFNDMSTRGVDINLETGQADFNARIKESLESAPSKEAREALQLQADSMYSKKLFPMHSKYQARRNIDRRLNSYKSAQDDILKDVVLGRTSFEEAADRNEVVLGGMGSTLGGVVDANQERISSFNNLTTSHLSGRINQGDSQSVISEVKSGKWDEFADAKTLGRIVDVARRDITQRENTSRVAYLDGAKDYVNFLKSGQDDAALQQQYSPAEVKNLVKGENGKRLANDIEDARAFGQVMTDIKDASVEELNQMLAKEMPKSADRFTREAQQMNVLTRAVQQRQKAIQADPAGYVNQNTRLGQFAFEELQESMASDNPALIKESVTKYNTVQKANQVHMGVRPESVQLVPKVMEAMYIERLNDMSEGGLQSVEQINFLKETYGDDFSLVRNQLVNSGNLKGGITVVADMDASTEQAQLAEAIAIPKKEYKGILEDEAFKEITQDTKLQLQEFASSTTDPVYFNEHREAVERLAMKLMVDGFQDDASDAIDAAMDKVINDRYELVKDYRIPRKFNTTNVEFGVEKVLEQVKSGEIDLLIPSSGQVVSEEDRKSVFLDKLTPYARTLQDNTGIVFTHHNGNAIMQSNGEPLVIKFEELEKETPSFFERLF